MEETVTPQNSSGKQYLFVAIFLLVLVGVGAFFIITGRKKESSVLQNPTPSATISSETLSDGTLSTESSEVSIKEVSKDTKMDKVTELQIVDEKIGNGAEAVSGKTITVNYVGTLTDGTKFDSSYDRNQPFSFTLGAGEVIEGWDKGFSGMKVGGKRKLTIPSSMGYGDSGIPGAIPGGATLIFEVELLKVD